MRRSDSFAQEDVVEVVQDSRYIAEGKVRKGIRLLGVSTKGASGTRERSGLVIGAIRTGNDTGV
jgi:hypothetical protein